MKLTHKTIAKCNLFVLGFLSAMLMVALDRHVLNFILTTER